MKNRSPWAWIPSLYFAEGLPYVVVMILSVIMYKRMEVSNTDIALYTSWLYFPWVIKPIWSPFVDLIRTKRWWIYAMQLLIGAGMAGVAFTLPGDLFLRCTLAFFWLIFRASARTFAASSRFVTYPEAFHVFRLNLAGLADSVSGSYDTLTSSSFSAWSFRRL